MCTPTCGCKNKQRQSTRFNLAKSEYRYEQFRGRRHIVVPVVLAKSNVVMNDALFPEEEYLPVTWNGVPVTVGHPSSDNEFLSANSPQTLEEWAVGHIFNAQIVDGDLRGEAWIDVQVANNAHPGLIDAIVNGDKMDVSTGYFCEPEEMAGEINGNAYSEIARAVRPDHLALLPNETGACSWADGCGIRSNRRFAMKVNEALEVLKNAIGIKPTAVVNTDEEDEDQQEKDDMATGDMTKEVKTMTEEEVAAIVDKAVANALKTHAPKLSDADAAALATAHKINADAKAALVSRVTSNSAITKEQAEAMDMATLEVIANGLPEPVADYSGRAFGGRVNAGEKDPVAEGMAPPSVVQLFQNAGKK